MIRKTLLAAAVIALTPAIAFAAPTALAPKATPAVTQMAKADKAAPAKLHHVVKKHHHTKAKTTIKKA
jgi:hypothetical protein